MTDVTTDVDVLVVGAGPVGLFLPMSVLAGECKTFAAAHARDDGTESSRTERQSVQ